VASVTAEGDQFTVIPYDVSRVSQSIMLAFVPAKTALSSYVWTEQKGSKSAYIFKSDSFSIKKTIYDVSGNPPTPSDYVDGPTGWRNRYGDRRKFFAVGPTSYVWQCKTTMVGKLTTFVQTTQMTIDLDVDEGFILAAATAGRDDEIYYVTI
jgi:hypothetical protein